MAVVQRLYQLTSAPPKTTGHKRSVWTGALASGLSFAWIEAEQTTYAWPAGVNIVQLPLSDVLYTTDLYRALKVNGYGVAYKVFRDLVNNRSSNFQNPYDLNIIKDSGMTHYWPIAETSGTSATDKALAGAIAATYSGNIGVGTTASPFSDTQRKAALTGGTSGFLTAASVGIGTTYTIEFWMKTAYNSTEVGVFSLVSAAKGPSWTLVNPSSINIKYYFRSTLNSISRQISSGVGTVNNGNWHHHAFTCTGSAVAYFFDGISVGGDSGLTAVSVTGTMNLGIDDAHVYIPSTGLSALAIYNRVLTGAEFLAHMAAI